MPQFQTCSCKIFVAAKYTFATANLRLRATDLHFAATSLLLRLHWQDWVELVVATKSAFAATKLFLAFVPANCSHRFCTCESKHWCLNFKSALSQLRIFVAAKPETQFYHWKVDVATSEQPLVFCRCKNKIIAAKNLQLQTRTSQWQHFAATTLELCQRPAMTEPTSHGLLSSPC